MSDELLKRLLNLLIEFMIAKVVLPMFRKIRDYIVASGMAQKALATVQRVCNRIASWLFGLVYA